MITIQLLKAWHAVAHASSLQPAHPMGIRLHGQRFAAWGDQSERPATDQDRFPRKTACLSAGNVIDGALTRGHHGWCFARNAACRSWLRISTLSKRSPPSSPISMVGKMCFLAATR